MPFKKAHQYRLIYTNKSSFQCFNDCIAHSASDGVFQSDSCEPRANTLPQWGSIWVNEWLFQGLNCLNWFVCTVLKYSLFARCSSVILLVFLISKLVALFLPIDTHSSHSISIHPYSKLALNLQSLTPQSLNHGLNQFHCYRLKTLKNAQIVWRINLKFRQLGGRRRIVI